jgi:intein/homing endonuclease
MGAQKGEHRAPETEIQPGQHIAPETEFKKGLVPWNKGLRYSLRRWEREEYRIPSLLKWQWAYIAGFIDGEGHISYRPVPRSDYRIVVLGITQKRKAVLELIQRWLNLPKGLTVRGRGTKIECHALQITAQNQVLKILKMLYPLLIVKQEKAKEAILYLESKGRYTSKRKRVLIRVS